MQNYIGLENTINNLESKYFAFLYPNVYDDNVLSKTPLNDIKECLVKAFSYVLEEKNIINDYADIIVNKLETVKEIIDTDIEAAYSGDPAATCKEEIVLSYPAFKAISVYRFAHEMYLLKIPIVPRMLCETMHKLTGIDIHPGATIGKYFFIDHGTGVVIGETTTIGEHVKIYQNVTLGAKSFDVADDGSLVKGIKRHPNIGNNVVIYAGATIIGGQTYIGDNAVIGGGTWVTHSVPANETISLRNYKIVK